MKQLELFEDGLVPIQRYLHVWSEAERDRRLKKEPAALAVPAAGLKPAEAGREKPLSILNTCIPSAFCLQRKGRGECT